MPKDDNMNDYVQYYLRKWCLQYGATLVYTSAKENINCDVLQNVFLTQIHKDILDSDNHLIPEVCMQAVLLLNSIIHIGGQKRCYFHSMWQ